MSTNWIQRLEAKFPDFQELVNFNGDSRENNRTKLHFTCKICGVSFTKEQYNLLHSSSVTIIRCPNCSKRKTPEKITTEMIAAEVSASEATLLDWYHKNSQIMVHFRCLCGNEHTVIRRIGFKYRCPNCQYKTLREASSTRESYETVKAWFESFGAELLSKEYINANIPLVYKCRCGNISHIRYSRRLSGGKPRCINCANWEQSGSNNPRYKGIEEYERKRRGSAIKSWYNRVMRKSDYTCPFTGERNKGKLCAHHFYSWGSYPEKRLLISNGICISKEIHKEFHQKYGYGENTLHQFVEFAKTKGVILDEDKIDNEIRQEVTSL